MNFYGISCVTFSTEILPKLIACISVKIRYDHIKKAKIIHKKNKFFLFVFLCLFPRNLSYICLSRDVAALTNEETEYEKVNFLLCAGGFILPDS